MRFQEKRRRHPGLPEPDHQHAFIFKFHLETSFATDHQGFARSQKKK
jgi:hypothetical protein